MREVWNRLWYGLDPELRRSRFHRQKGHLALGSPKHRLDCVLALTTAMTRNVFRWGPQASSFTFPAAQFLKRRLRPPHGVFERGSGMSTLWLERRCAEVHSLEHDPKCFRAVAARPARRNPLASGIPLRT